jgi:hypothetical protein
MPSKIPRLHMFSHCEYSTTAGIDLKGSLLVEVELDLN